MAKKEKQPKAGKAGKSAKAEKSEKGPPPPKPRLQERYEQEILPQLSQQLGRENRLSLPRLDKIVVSMGVSSAITDKKMTRLRPP